MGLRESLSGLEPAIRVFTHLACIIPNEDAQIMLSQIDYWTEQLPYSSNGWFYKTRIQMAAETGLTLGKVDAARAFLVANGFIKEMKAGIPCRCFYKINMEKIKSAWIAAEAEATNIRKIKANKTGIFYAPLPTMSAEERVEYVDALDTDEREAKEEYEQETASLSFTEDATFCPVLAESPNWIEQNPQTISVTTTVTTTTLHCETEKHPFRAIGEKLPIATASYTSAPPSSQGGSSSTSDIPPVFASSACPPEPGVLACGVGVTAGTLWASMPVRSQGGVSMGIPPMQPLASKRPAVNENRAVWDAWTKAMGVIPRAQQGRDQRTLYGLMGHYAQAAKTDKEKDARRVAKFYTAAQVIACINALVECGVHVTSAGIVPLVIEDFLTGNKPWPDMYFNPKKQRESAQREAYLEDLREKSRQTDIAAGVGA